MNQNLSSTRASSRLALCYYYYCFSLLSLLLTFSAELRWEQECSGTDGTGGRWWWWCHARSGSQMKECQVVCQLLHHCCWTGLADWSHLRPTRTIAIQTKSVLACSADSPTPSQLNSASATRHHSYFTTAWCSHRREEAAAAASISAILQVFRTWAAKMW